VLSRTWTGKSIACLHDYLSREHANCLFQQGIQYEIFDKRGPETPQRDWGVTVHWAVEFLELYPEETVKRIKTARVVQRDDDTHQEFVRFYDGETGETIRDIPLGPAKRFSHGRIRGLLAESLPIQVSFQVKCKRLGN